MAPLATIAIISIGEMGLGIAKLLIAHNYRVITNLSGRSPSTATRATSASIEILPSEEQLVQESSYILSIVPPRDALSTAQRVTTAYNSLSPKKSTPLYYLDLNAISPYTALSLSTHFSTAAPEIKFLDGGIIGSAPSLKTPPSPNGQANEGNETWNKPSIPLSGPFPLSESPNPELDEFLNINHISSEIGPASGLKCCFATLTKGLTALAIQSFSSAEALGVLPHLKDELEARVPGIWKSAARGVTGMPPKAYRWVGEMEEISRTHGDAVGWDKDGKGVFDAVANVYRVVAEETVLGEEKTESRKRGMTLEDVAVCVGEGLGKRRKRGETNGDNVE